MFRFRFRFRSDPQVFQNLVLYGAAILASSLSRVSMLTAVGFHPLKDLMEWAKMASTVFSLVDMLVMAGCFSCLPDWLVGFCLCCLLIIYVCKT
jgi:hypothetical protein